MKQKQEGQETITIQEEVQIPGTDVVLEKGDRISVIDQESPLNEGMDDGMAEEHDAKVTGSKRRGYTIEFDYEGDRLAVDVGGEADRFSPGGMGPMGGPQTKKKMMDVPGYGEVTAAELKSTRHLDRIIGSFVMILDKVNGDFSKLSRFDPQFYEV